MYTLWKMRVIRSHIQTHRPSMRLDSRRERNHNRTIEEVSLEAYKVLRKSPSTAVPVFFGKIDLAMIYFLHGACPISHTLRAEQLKAQHLWSWARGFSRK